MIALSGRYTPVMLVVCLLMTGIAGATVGAHSAADGGEAIDMYDRLYEEYEVDGDLVLFRCAECGQTDLSVGSLHAHIEGHRGYTRLGIQIPFTKTSPGRVGELVKRTEVLLVDETGEISLAEVEGL